MINAGKEGWWWRGLACCLPFLPMWLFLMFEARGSLSFCRRSSPCTDGLWRAYNSCRGEAPAFCFHLDSPDLLKPEMKPRSSVIVPFTSFFFSFGSVLKISEGI